MTGWPKQWEAERTTEFIELIIGAAVGGSGLVGLLFYLLRRYMEKKLTALEDAAHNRRTARIKRTQIEDEMTHAYGRLLFWLYRSIATGQHNGELDAAYEALQVAEARKKEWDRRIIAEAQNDR